MSSRLYVLKYSTKTKKTFLLKIIITRVFIDRCQPLRVVAVPGIAAWQAVAMQCGGSAIIKVEYNQGEVELFVNNIAMDRFDDDVPQMYNGTVRLFPPFNWCTHVDVIHALLFSKPTC